MNRPSAALHAAPSRSIVVGMLIGIVMIGMAIAGAGGAAAQEDNSPPSVELGQNQTITTGETLTFEPTATDADGEIAGFAWRVNGVLVSREDTLNYTFREPGEFEIEVTAFDDDGATATDTVTVTVNAPPSAEIAVPSTDANTLSFSANASDPDGSIESYEWRIDGETVSSEESFTHTFESAGTHKVALTVTDDRGAQTTVVTHVQVEMPDDSGDGGIGGSIPGFGVGVGLLGLLIVVGLAAGRRR